MTSRRGFIKKGSAASIGITSIAGCSESGEPTDDSGGNNNDPGGNGSGSNSGDLTEINLTYAPSGFEGVVSRHIVEETDILLNEMNDAGYSLNMESSWRGPALFASGSADFESIGAFEASRLAVERETPIAINASWARANTGAYVKTGSEWSVSETGSIEASLRKIAEEGGRVGLVSWSVAPALVWQIFFNFAYDLEFSETGGDFRVQIVELPAAPELVESGDLAMTLSGPQYGAITQIRDDAIEPLFHTQDLFINNDQPFPVYNSWATTQEFANNNPEAIQALINAWQEGMDWFFEDPITYASREENWDAIGAENADQAEWIAKWAFSDDMGLSEPVLTENVALTEERISADREFINFGVDSGAIPEGWEEAIEYRTVNPE